MCAQCVSFSVLDTICMRVSGCACQYFVSVCVRVSVSFCVSVKISMLVCVSLGMHQNLSRATQWMCVSACNSVHIGLVLQSV